MGTVAAVTAVGHGATSAATVVGSGAQHIGSGAVHGALGALTAVGHGVQHVGSGAVHGVADALTAVGHGAQHVGSGAAGVVKRVRHFKAVPAEPKVQPEIEKSWYEQACDRMLSLDPWACCCQP